jgi:hypothetical protein
MKKIINFFNSIFILLFAIALVSVFFRIVIEVIMRIGGAYHSFSRFLIENELIINIVFTIFIIPVLIVGATSTLYNLVMWSWNGIKYNKNI